MIPTQAINILHTEFVMQTLYVWQPHKITPQGIISVCRDRHSVNHPP